MPWLPEPELDMTGRSTPAIRASLAAAARLMA